MATKAFQQPYKYTTLVPKVDLTTHRYKAVSIDTTGDAILAVAGSVIVGINQGTDDIGEPAQIMTDGISFYVSVGATAAGEELEVGANGALQTLAAGKSVGICLVGAADGAIGCFIMK